MSTILRVLLMVCIYGNRNLSLRIARLEKIVPQDKLQTYGGNKNRWSDVVYNFGTESQNVAYLA